MSDQTAQSGADAPQSEGAELHGPDQQFASGDVIDRQPDGGKGWFQRVLQSRGYRSSAEAAGSRKAGEPLNETGKETDSKDESAAEAKSGEAAQEAKVPTDDQPFRVFRNKAEYDAEIARQAQSMKDRQIAAERRAERQRQRAELREKDPIEFAQKDAEWEAEEKAEAARQAQVGQESARLSTVLNRMADTYDAEVITPVMDLLDEKVRADLIKRQPDEPIKGRAFLVTEGIKALVKAAKDEAKEELRKSEAFRKEMLVDLRGEEDEPELAPAAGGGAETLDMNAVIRAGFRRRYR